MNLSKCLLPLVLLGLTYLNVSGQSPSVTISGRIVDGSSKEVLPYTTVILKTLADSTVVDGTISDELGSFKIPNIRPGNYHLEISFVGYKRQYLDVFAGKLNQYLDLGTITLEVDELTLNEVLVVGERTTLSEALDKKTYGVDENLAQSGGSVLDAMRALPGVTIDQEGKIILRGSDKVTVLIDGNQSALTGYGNQKGLNNIPASNIDRIEIINNPSAKYNAAGMAGIVNIIYKKEKDLGIHGEAGISLGLGAVTKRNEDLPTDLGSFSANPKILPNLNLNYNTSKINFFLQSSILFQEGLPNNEFTTRYYDDQRVIASQVPENRRQTHYIISGGIDWNPDEFNSLTISGIYDYEIHVDTAQVPFIDLTTESRERFYSWNEEEITGYSNITLNYKHLFRHPGHSISGSFQYTKGWEDESYFLQDSSAIRQSGDTTMLLAEEFTTNLNVDYIKPMKYGRFETGSRLQWRRIPVEYTVGRGVNSIIYNGLGDRSKWGENIFSTYLNLVIERPQYDIEGGLRAEYTDVSYDIAEENIYYSQNDAYNYFELFPNVRITLNINDNNRVSAFFNRRIDRPGEPELRIFPKYDDPELLKVGNPYLRPQFTEAYELAYNLNWERGSLYLAGYYRFIDAQFLRIYNEDTTNTGDIINKIYQNTGSAANSGLEFILSHQLLDSWKITASINWFLSKIDAYKGTLLFPYTRDFMIEESKEDTWDLKLNNQFELSSGLKFQLTGIYYAPRIVPQGRQLARSSVDLGAGKKVLTGRGEITVSFSDIFNQFGIQQELIGDGFTATYKNFYETQVFRVGFKYKF